ncbi:MAG: VOC family protein [Inquilinaceae bacterium]
MSPVLDHTIVHARSPAKSAAFLVEVLDLPAPKILGHFTVVQVGSSSLDFLQADEPIASRHFAFRVTEEDFDGVLSRLKAGGISYRADPFHRLPNQINHWDDGRGVYFDDPDGHVLEVITRSYGSAGCAAKHPNPLLDCK